MTHDTEVDDILLDWPDEHTEPELFADLKAVVKGRLEKHINHQLQKAREEAVAAERERIMEKYGNYDDGCGCCSYTTLRKELTNETLTPPDVRAY